MDGSEVTEVAVDILGFAIPETAAKLIFLGLVILVALILSRVLTGALRGIWDVANIPAASIVLNVVRFLVWMLALLVVLQPVFGVEPTAFVAALGVTSVALSLGLQSTLSNLFGGFTMMLSKGLTPGDVITFNDITGVVTDVSWRATTVRQFSGNVLVIPNSELSSTSLIKLSPFMAYEYTLPIMIRKDADLSVVRADVERLAREALGEHFDETFGAPIFINEFCFFGIKAIISLHVKPAEVPGLSPGVARTAMADAIAGSPWLA